MAYLDESVDDEVKLAAQNVKQWTGTVSTFCLLHFFLTMQQWNSSSCHLYASPHVCAFAEVYIRPRVENEQNLTVGERILDECNLFG